MSDLALEIDPAVELSMTGGRYRVPAPPSWEGWDATILDASPRAVPATIKLVMAGAWAPQEQLLTTADLPQSGGRQGIIVCSPVRVEQNHWGMANSSMRFQAATEPMGAAVSSIATLPLPVELLLAVLRAWSPITYRAQLADRITEILRDFKESGISLSVGSMHALLTFLEQHRPWPMPHVYGNDDGLLQARWFVDGDQYHLALEFQHDRSVRIAGYAPVRGAPIERYGVLDLNQALADLEVERWIGRARSPAAQ